MILHPCAAEACDKQIARHLFMCMPHWRMVPKALQLELRRAWSSYSFRRGQRDKDLDEIMRDGYLNVRKRAIDAVREKEIKRDLRNKQHGDVLNFE